MLTATNNAMEILKQDAIRISLISDNDIVSISNILKENDLNNGSVKLYKEFFLKIEVDNILAGCIALIPRDGFTEIKSLLVTKQYRSYQMFNLICKALEVRGKFQNNHLIVLKVDTNNDVIPLYIRKGFKILNKNEYPDIFKALYTDCQICQKVIMPVCNPEYYILNLNK